VARAALLGALVAAGGSPADDAAVLAFLKDFETRYPAAGDLHVRALEQRLVARIDAGELEEAAPDLDRYLRLQEPGPERRRILARLGRDLTRQAEGEASPSRARALDLARTVYGALAAETGAAADRLLLAEVTLRAGDAVSARRLYEEVLAADAGSAEALRGTARAAATAGDRDAALAYWRRVAEASPPGGTAWYEARLAQVTLLVEDGRGDDACRLVRSSRGRATSAGADQLDARLRGLEPQVCR
jgi:tetratricopeptide (TPR) repeat protein